MKFSTRLLPVLIADAIVHAFPAPSTDGIIPVNNDVHIVSGQALLCPTGNATLDPLGRSSVHPDDYTFYLNRVAGSGDPHDLTAVLDNWITRLSAHSDRESIPDTGLVFETGGLTEYELHVAQAGDRQLWYYHATRGAQMLWEHYDEMIKMNKGGDSEPLMEVRITADGVLEGTVRLVTDGGGGCGDAGNGVAGGVGTVETS